MKLLFISLVVTILLNGACDAQFFGGVGGFGGGATQNCAGSQCNQNNFGKKKREIVSEILELTEEALDAEKQEEEAKEIQKRDAQVQNCQGSACNQNNLGGGGFAGFGGFPGAAGGFGGGVGGGAAQNCVGSQCNQNNFGKRKREIASAIQSLTEEAFEEVNEIQKREAQVQNCQGSACNQNNLGGGFGGFGAFPAGVFGGVGGGATQNCVGSQCNQNNLGRKKRAIEDAVHALTEDILKAEDEEAKEIQKREAQVQNCQGSSCNQNNLGGGFGGFGAFPGAVGGFGGGATQNCVGSQCNQNNLGRRKRAVVDKLLEAVSKVVEEEQAQEDLHSQEKREAQVQNCQGSACNQNNLGGGFGGFGGFPGGAVGFGGGASQNCVGSQCNQNNFGRRKREVIAALVEEARKITEKDFEDEKRLEEARGSII